mgnify:CR=1 FL=1
MAAAKGIAARRKAQGGVESLQRRHADIERGGVFAQIIGTLELLTPEERARVIGIVINKFRGDISVLRPGLDMIRERTGIPVLGVLGCPNLPRGDGHGTGAIFVGVRGGGAWELLAIDTESPYMDERALLTPGTPEVREYRARYWDKGTPNGDWTDVAKVTVSP